MGGGAAIFELDFVPPPESKGMLCRELSTLPRGTMGGNAVSDAGLWPTTGDSSPLHASLFVGDGNFTCSVVSMVGGGGGMCIGGGIGMADLRLADPYEERFR